MTAPTDIAALCARLRDIDASMDGGWANDTMEEAADAIEALANALLTLIISVENTPYSDMALARQVRATNKLLGRDAAIDRARGEP